MLIFLFSVVAASVATHVEMERMLPALPPHIRQVSHPPPLAPTHPHELIISVKPRNLDILVREVELRASPASPGDVYQRWLTDDDVTALTAPTASADVVLAWIAELADYAGTGTVAVTFVSRRRDYIRVTAPLGLWAEVLHATFAVYSIHVHDGSDDGDEEDTPTDGGWQEEEEEEKEAAAEAEAEAQLEELKMEEQEQEVAAGAAATQVLPWPRHLLVRAGAYSLPAAVAAHVESVFNTVQVRATG